MYLCTMPMIFKWRLQTNYICNSISSFKERLCTYTALLEVQVHICRMLYNYLHACMHTYTCIDIYCNVIGLKFNYYDIVDLLLFIIFVCSCMYQAWIMIKYTIYNYLYTSWAPSGCGPYMWPYTFFYSIACSCYDIMKWPVWSHVLNIITHPFFLNIKIPEEYPMLTMTIELLVFKQHHLWTFPPHLIILGG